MTEEDVTHVKRLSFVTNYYMKCCPGRHWHDLFVITNENKIKLFGSTLELVITCCRF